MLPSKSFLVGLKQGILYFLLPLTSNSNRNTHIRFSFSADPSSSSRTGKMTNFRWRREDHPVGVVPHIPAPRIPQIAGSCGWISWCRRSLLLEVQSISMDKWCGWPSLQPNLIPSLPLSFLKVSSKGDPKLAEKPRPQQQAELSQSNQWL